MKIVHLSTYDRFGGAAIAAYRQHTALRRSGMDSVMVVRHKTTNDPAVQLFGGGSKVERLTRIVRRIRHGVHVRSIKNFSGMALRNGDVGGEIYGWISDADVINIHQVEGFLDESCLFNAIPASTPVVITLHDLGWVTGGCSYPTSCNRFADQCGACPQISSERDSDITRKFWHLRAANFNRFKEDQLAWVADSKWVRSEAERSSLLSAGVNQIYYGIDTNIFHPGDRSAAKRALGLSCDHPTIMFAAASVEDERKGVSLLIDAINGCADGSEWQLLTAGGGHIRFPSGIRHLHAGAINSEEVMASLYRAADVFVMPSKEEAFGQTALEAVSCGTPVVAFAVGGIPEIVVPGTNGVLVHDINSDGLQRGILSLLDNTSLRRTWPFVAKSWVEQRFSYAHNARQYTELYESLLG